MSTFGEILILDTLFDVLKRVSTSQLCNKSNDLHESGSKELELLC